MPSQEADPPDPTTLARMRVLEVLGDEIGRAVTNLYRDVADDPSEGYHFPTGRRALELAGYDEEDLATVPDATLARYAGVGCTFRYARPEPGDAVLDLGCGAGTDMFIAAHAVGEEGRVVGVDLTDQMVEAASSALEAAGIDHTEVVQARAPKLDVSGSFDMVTSNGALNLIPDKERTLSRLHDLLRPGGRLVVADIALTHPPSMACLADAELWAECLVGAYTEERYLEALEEAGFEEVTVHERRDYFQHSPSEKTRETAKDLGAFAWVIETERPPD